MKSSDQRYRHVQRYKRDPREWEQWSKALVLALRDVRLGEGSFDAVADAIRGGAAEWDHLLLACGRTATAFHENFRRGSPGHHTIRANDLCPVEVLAGAKLDGFSVLRLSREQTKNVKLRWAKLREQDILIHDPQGTHWTRVVGCMIDGQRDEHLGLLEDLRDRGQSLVLYNQEKGEEYREARADKELDRFFRNYAGGFDEYVADGRETPPEVYRDGALRHFAIVKCIYSTGSYIAEKSAAEARVELERSLCVAELYLATGRTDRAIWDADTSHRHCSAARLRERMAAVEREFAARGLAEELAAQVEERAADKHRYARVS